MTDVQREQIIKLRMEGKGYGTIAQMLGVSPNTIKSFCRRNELRGDAVEVKPVVLSGETTSCQNCGRTIQQIAKQKKKRFCCDKCRNTWWNSHLDLVKRKTVYEFECPHCGKKFHIYGDKRRKYCSHECYIADRFKGGDGDE